jgi:hypothetical protein
MTFATPRLSEWRKRVASRPAVRTVVVQFVATLRKLTLVVPEFMTDAIVERSESVRR